jgi:acetyltransferase
LGYVNQGNPVDIIGDALAERYIKALDILLEDPNSVDDNLLIIHVPTAISPSEETAKAVVAHIAQKPRAVKRKILTAWLIMGGFNSKKNRESHVHKFM